MPAQPAPRFASRLTGMARRHWLAAALLWLASFPILPLSAQPAPQIWRAGVVLQAPYAAFGTNGDLDGHDISLLSQLARKQGARIEWLTFASPPALEAAHDAGRLDLALGALQTPDGLRRWLYTDPYLRIPFIAVTGRDVHAVALTQMTAGAPVLVSDASHLLEPLQQSLPMLRIEASPDVLSALREVAEGWVDYAVVDQVQFDLLSRQRLFAGLVQAEQIGYPLLRRIAVRRDAPDLARQLDTSLAALPAADIAQLRQQWLIPPGADDWSPGWWRSLAVLGGLLAVFCAAAAVWQMRQRPLLERRVAGLRQQLSLRDQEREALRLTQFSVDQSVTGILWVNWDSRIRYVNAAAAHMLSLPVTAVLERPLEDFDPAMHMDSWLALWRQVRDDTPPAGTETQWRRGNGDSLPVAVNLSFLRFGTAEYLVIFLADLTEKRRAAAALAEREAQLRGISANVPGMIFRMEQGPSDDGAVLTFVSDGCRQLVGREPGWLTDMQRGLRALIHPADEASYVARRDAAMQARQDWQWQGRMRAANGEERWVDLKAAVRHLNDERIVWDGVVWDISDIKQAELALARSQAQLRELSAHLETVREEEKARIAREVHDELGQVLTVLKFDLSILGLVTPDPTLPQRERLDSMRRLITQLFQLVRDVATALRPPILDAGIVSAIEWQARRFETRSGIACLVVAPEHIPPLTDAQATGLFRILQEALTNVMRHAQAHSVEIRLALEDGMLALTIADDGVGFQPDAARRSFGVVGMRERVLMLGGDLAIDGQLGHGTTLTARIPLREPGLTRLPQGEEA